MENKIKEFGLRVKQLRKEYGYSQEDLANKMGVHRTYVGMIERGEKNLTLLKIYQLANALELDIKELFDLL